MERFIDFQKPFLHSVRFLVVEEGLRIFKGVGSSRHTIKRMFHANYEPTNEAFSFQTLRRSFPTLKKTKVASTLLARRAMCSVRCLVD